MPTGKQKCFGKQTCMKTDKNKMVECRLWISINKNTFCGIWDDYETSKNSHSFELCAMMTQNNLLLRNQQVWETFDVYQIWKGKQTNEMENSLFLPAKIILEFCNVFSSITNFQMLYHSSRVGWIKIATYSFIKALCISVKNTCSGDVLN